MTREEEIEIALSKYIEERGDYGDYIAEAERDAAFKAGAKWADNHPKNVWHDTTEEPQQDRLMLGIDCEGASIYKWIGQDPNGWYSFIKEIGLSKWAYISDLLPKGGE